LGGFTDIWHEAAGGLGLDSVWRTRLYDRERGNLGCREGPEWLVENLPTGDRNGSSGH
jgi:hypothetical protein